MDELLDNNEKERLNLSYRPVLIWIGFLILALMFKLMHWPGANLLLILTTGGVTAHALSKTIVITGVRNPLFLFLTISGIVWAIVLLWGAFFNGGHPLNSKGLGVYFTVFVVYFGIYLTLDLSRLRRYRNQQEKS